MQLDPKELRQLLAYLLETFCQMEQELLAHQIVLLGIQKSHLLGEELDQLLTSARECPELRQHLQEKYESVMVQLRDEIESDLAVEQGLAFLRMCKPPGSLPH